MVALGRSSGLHTFFLQQHWQNHGIENIKPLMPVPEALKHIYFLSGYNLCSRALYNHPVLIRLFAFITTISTMWCSCSFRHFCCLTTPTTAESSLFSGNNMHPKINKGLECFKCIRPVSPDWAFFLMSLNATNNSRVFSYMSVFSEIVLHNSL